MTKEQFFILNDRLYREVKAADDAREKAFNDYHIFLMKLKEKYPTRKLFTFSFKEIIKLYKLKKALFKAIKRSNKATDKWLNHKRKYTKLRLKEALNDNTKIIKRD